MADNEVIAQKNKLVGDEAVQKAGHTPEPEVNDDSAKAQVAPPREADAKEVAVYETSVEADKVVTDPSSPEAVQVPDAGRGSTDLPLHRLAEGTVEDKFSGGSKASAPASDKS